MTYDLIITGGEVVTPRSVGRRDVGIRAGKIARIGRIGCKSARRHVDARGCLVIPGGVDPHVHFDLPIGPGMSTADDFDTGTRAAAAGGITTVIDYTTPQAGQTPLQAFRERRKRADGAVHVDYNLHNVLIAWRGAWTRDLLRLKRLGAPSVKLFMIYRDRGWQADDGTMLAVMEACRSLGMTVCVHAENDSLIGEYTGRIDPKRAGASGLARARPPLVEEEAAARAVRLAGATGARLHLVHLSTAGAAATVGRARRRGVRVSGETCPQYLALDLRALGGREGHLWGCCPPLRGKRERDGLWDALGNAWLQAIGTDHCTFTRRQKSAWRGDYTRIPYGLPGVETSLPVTWTHGVFAGRLTLPQWVRLHSEGPAKMFGLWPRKGSIRKGADADVVVWDPKASRRITADRLETACDWNPYQGKVLRGIARHVFLRGIEIAREGRYVGPGDEGRFVPRR